MNKYLAVAIVVLNFSLLTTSYELYRLPKSITPSHYKLEIITHLENGDSNDFKFYGKVWIKLFCHEDTKNITLHSKNLDINTSKIELIKVSLDTNERTNVEIESTYFTGQYEFFTINTKEILSKDQHYNLFIPFEAELNVGLLGYYRSSYLDQKTQKTVWLAVTQFESTFARRAFPCFDEPEMKAKFEISLGHNKKYVALSNMPIKSSNDMVGKTDWIWDHFEETVPMSTYLVAYTVNDFECKESISNSANDVIFKIWARRDAIDQVDYAKDIGPKVLKFYENYFDIKFPLPKVDMIAIPDFSAGAMENWGLVTYRETALLFQPNISSSTSKHRVASVIAHELAHQWFGNLVTMKWWTDLWLNEGFATYVASLGVDYLHPEWNSFDEESVDNSLNIFKFDSLRSSHPVSAPIGDPSEIAQIFDKISYAKGSSIIRMMHLFLGEEVFRTGVSNYLKKHKYGNAEQDNLWESLTDEAHKHNSLPKLYTIKNIMDSWTLQTGYPILSVTRNYKSNTAEITQMRYFSDNHVSSKDDKSCWWVPLSYTTKEQLDFSTTHPKAWLECDSDKKTLPKILSDLPDHDKWILYNIKFSALYKIKYDEHNWDLLITQLTGDQFEEISAISRAQLIDDALDLAWGGDQDYDIALRMLAYLKQEKAYIPWKSALSNLNAVNRLLKRTSQYGLFQEFMRNLLVPIYKNIGGFNMDVKPGSALDVIKHKILISSWACKFSVGDCESKSKEYFEQWSNISEPDENNPIPLDIRSVVYCTAIRLGSDKEWNFLWNRYLKSNVGAERVMILQALGCTREVWLLSRYLNWTLDESSGIRKQDAAIVFSSVTVNNIGFYLAKSFLWENVNSIHKYLQPDTSRLGRYITPLAYEMTSEKEYEEMKSFIDLHNVTFAKSSQITKQALETISLNSQWQQMNYNSIGRYLEKYI